MSEHHARVSWSGGEPDFGRGRYSRAHAWTFDGGVTVPASPSPAVVPAPWSDPAAVDPEEAFVASVASCHMLTFLWLAAKAGFLVTRYDDDAVGRMEKNARGVPWVAGIRLRPRITWGGAEPSPEQLAALHHDAHEQCFIANSIRTEVRVEPPVND